MRLDEAAEGATLVVGQARAGVGGHAPDVGLVHDRLAEGAPEGTVPLPVVADRVDDDALEGARVRSGRRFAGLAPVTRRDRHGPAIRIEQQASLVEPQSPRRVVRSGCTERIHLAGADPGDEGVPPRSRPITLWIEGHDAVGPTGHRRPGT